MFFFLKNQIFLVSSLPKEVERLRMVSQPEENQAVSKELEALKSEVTKLRSLNMRLQESIINKPSSTGFTEVPGYPEAKWLLSVSQNAQESDYLFVKELVFYLFPLGIGNATVTGHASNNPYGRGSRTDQDQADRAEVERIDPEKVEYIRGNIPILFQLLMKINKIF